MKKEFLFSILAAVVNISAFTVYNWQIFKGQAHPNITSWGLWAFMTVLNFTSYQAMSKDWLKSIVPTIGSFMCIVTFLLALRQGELRKFGSDDITVLAIGVTASLLWWKLKKPMVANMMLQVGLGVGFIPTIQGVWVNPQNEIALCWFLWTVGFTFQTIVVILRWKGKKGDLVYPVNCLWLHLLVALLALRA